MNRTKQKLRSSWFRAEIGQKDRLRPDTYEEFTKQQSESHGEHCGEECYECNDGDWYEVDVEAVADEFYISSKHELQVVSSLPLSESTGRSMAWLADESTLERGEWMVVSIATYLPGNWDAPQIQPAQVGVLVLDGDDDYWLVVLQPRERD